MIAARAMERATILAISGGGEQVGRAGYAGYGGDARNRSERQPSGLGAQFYLPGFPICKSIDESFSFADMFFPSDIANSARDYGLEASEPRQGRKAATAA